MDRRLAASDATGDDGGLPREPEHGSDGDEASHAKGCTDDATPPWQNQPGRHRRYHDPEHRSGPQEAR